MANKSVEKTDLNFILSHRAPNAIWSDGERNLIGRRTQSDWTANAIRLGGERNLIGRRTVNDGLSSFIMFFVVKLSALWHRLHLEIAVFANSILHICDF